MRRVALAALLIGCLPEDTRPPPSEVLVTLRGAETTIRGVTTVDGWTIRFERVIVSLGGSDLEGDACDDYADGDYFRILDAQLDKPQKVGLMYGLGTCEFQLRARNPESDSLLGENVGEDLKTMMREPGRDPYEELAGITYLVRGLAQRGAEQKVFQWDLRRRRLAYSECLLTGEDGSQKFTLGENGKKTIELQVHAEVLFHDSLDASKATLRFEHLAAADLDGDGAITIEELAKVPLDGKIDVAGVEGAENWKTLGEAFYDGLFPRIVRTGDRGRCEITTRRPDRPQH
jgi:hypothetical protein